MAEKPMIAHRTPCIVEKGPDTVLLVSMWSIENAAVLRWTIGTVFSLMKIHYEEKKRVAFYGCKQTRQPPFFDGSHSRI